MSKFAQKLKEKAGMADAGYSADVKAVFDHGKQTKAKVLDDLCEKLVVQTRLYNALIEHSKVIATAFEHYGEHFKEAEPALATHFAVSAQWEKATTEMLQSFTQANVMWQNDVKAYIDGEYQEAKKSERNYDSARLSSNAAEGALSKAKSDEEKKKLQTNVDAGHLALSEAEKVAVAKWRHSNALAHAVLESCLNRYWKDYSTYFKTGSNFLEAKRSAKEGVYNSQALLKIEELKFGASKSGPESPRLEREAATSATTAPAAAAAAAAAAASPAATTASPAAPAAGNTSTREDADSDRPLTTVIGGSNPFADLQPETKADAPQPIAPSSPIVERDLEKSAQKKSLPVPGVKPTGERGKPMMGAKAGADDKPQLSEKNPFA